MKDWSVPQTTLITKWDQTVCSAQHINGNNEFKIISLDYGYHRRPNYKHKWTIKTCLSHYIDPNVIIILFNVHVRKKNHGM